MKIIIKLIINVTLIFSLFLLLECKDKTTDNTTTVKKTLEVIKAPQIDDYRTLKEIGKGVSIEVRSSVSGTIEMLTETDETMAKMNSKNPHVYCMLPTDYKVFKLNFEPADNTLGVQRIFFVEPNKNNYLIEISSDGNKPIKIKKTIRENILFDQLEDIELETSNKSTDSIYDNSFDTDLEGLIGEDENSNEEMSESKEITEEIKKQEKASDKIPNQEEAIVENNTTKNNSDSQSSNETARSITNNNKEYFDLGKYIIPENELWFKDKANSDSNTITMVSKQNNFVEMVVLSKDIYDLRKRDKAIFLKEMYQNFNNDPSYTDVKLYKDGRYTILGIQNCPMITSISDNMKVYCFTPYYRGNFHVILAFSSDYEEPRMSLNLEDFLRSISIP